MALVDMFPAHAGMIPMYLAGKDAVRNVPRTRGDDPSALLLSMSSPLCSPHTRG